MLLWVKMCERPQFDYVLPWCDAPPVSDLIYRHTPLTGTELSVDLAQWPNHKPPQLHANIVKDTNNMHTHANPTTGKGSPNEQEY